MYRLLALILIAGSVFSQTSPQPLQVSRQYGITSATQVFDNRSVQRQCNAFGFMVTASTGSTWSVQMEYSDVSATGPWTAYPTGVVSNSNIIAVGGGYGYHQWIRLNTTSGGTTSTLSCAKDFYLPATGSGGSGSTGTASFFSGAAQLNPGSINDGTLATISGTITVPGASLGDTVQVYAALPAGVEIFGDVVAPNMVSIRILNLSGAAYSPGTVSFGASIVHFSNAGGGTGAMTKLSGAAVFNPGSITDGTLPILTTTITVNGAAVGDPVYVSTNSPLSSGVRAFAEVNSLNTVTLRLLNLNGGTYSPGTITFTSTVLHYVSGATTGSSELSGAATFDPGIINDGTIPVLGTNVSVSGAIVGDPVIVTTDASLPPGVRIFGDVISANTVSLRLVDLSGSPYSPGATVFNVSVWH